MDHLLYKQRGLKRFNEEKRQKMHEEGRDGSPGSAVFSDSRMKLGQMHTMNESGTHNMETTI